MHERIKHRGGVWALLAVMVLAVMAFAFTFTSPREASAAGTNLLQGKEVTASAQYDTMPANNLVDGKDDTRWSTEANATQWAYVDMDSEQTVGSFRVLWESAENYASAYNVYVSNSTDDWGTAVYSTTGNSTQENEVTLDTPATGRYIKLEVTAQHGYPSVSAFEFQAFAPESTEPTDPEEPVGPTQDPQENVARGKTAVADSSEADTLGADKAVDGDTTSKSSRWASAVDATASADGGPHWIYVDLGAEYDVKNIRIYWEMRKANGYHVDLATGDTVPGVDSSDWKTVYSNDGRPDSKTQTIELDAAQKARYVRLYVEHNTYDDPDGGTSWGNMSIYELEVYGGERLPAHG